MTGPARGGDGPRYVLAIDQGTTSTRCIVVDRAGRFVAVSQREHVQHYPRPGWVEHDATEIWRNVCRVVPRALEKAGLTASDVAAVGIANQRETTVLWDRATGVPVHRAVVWQDTRTDALVERLRAEDDAGEVPARSGLPLATYFAGPRIRWLLDADPRLRRRAERGEVLVGTMESWLIWNLTGGPDGGLHLTDVTNASRTLLMDIGSLEWDPLLCELLGVPRAALPRIVPSSQVYGTARVLLPGVPIGAALGDQQSALFGQTCFDPGDAKCTYGTGSFLLMNTGHEPARAGGGLLTTVGYRIGDAPAVYALEGSIAITGSLVQWLRDGLEIIGSAPEIETLALRVADNGGCYVVPAFAGLYTPYWRSGARGVIVGLTSYITKGHLARAVLEASGWQTREVVEAMNRGSGVELRRLRVDGGMTTNHLLMQFVADVLAVPVVRPMVSETVSLGAAYSAGLAVGFWPDLAALRRNWHRASEWRPAMAQDVRAREYANWKRAVERSFDWVPRAGGDGGDG